MVVHGKNEFERQSFFFTLTAIYHLSEDKGIPLQKPQKKNFSTFQQCQFCLYVAICSI